MSDAVTVSIVDFIADVRLNRPEKRNAIDSEVIAGLHQAVESISENSAVRVAVLSGEGKGFCAGLDMANIANMASGDLTTDSVGSAYDDLSPAGANMVQRLGWMWQELSIPVIAAIHGGAMGGGLNVALGADIRVVDPNAKLGFVEINFGLLPDMSATQSLLHLARLDRVKELIFTGRKFSGQEAYEYGLATVLSDSPQDTALKMAAEIANKNPEVIRAAKQLLNQLPHQSVKEGLIAESNCSRELMGTDNQIEAVMSTFEARPPLFK